MIEEKRHGAGAAIGAIVDMARATLASASPADVVWNNVLVARLRTDVLAAYPHVSVDRDRAMAKLLSGAAEFEGRADTDPLPYALAMVSDAFRQRASQAESSLDDAVFQAVLLPVQKLLVEDWPAAFRAALGDVAIAAGQLEYLIKIAYKRAAMMPFIDGMERAGEHNRDLRCRFIRQAVQLLAQAGHDREEATALLSRRGEIAVALEQRNNLLHGSIGRTKEGLTIVVRAVPGVHRNFVAQEVDIEDETLAAATVAERLQNVARRLDRLTREVLEKRIGTGDADTVLSRLYASASTVVAVATVGVVGSRPPRPTLRPSEVPDSVRASADDGWPDGYKPSS